MATGLLPGGGQTAVGTTTSGVANAGPPPAYPHPVVVPAPPGGDVAAARRLAAAYRDLAGDVVRARDLTARISGDLATSWHGDGTRALDLPHDVIDSNAATLRRALYDAADGLDACATKLEHAHHKHHHALTALLAIGAVIALDVVITVAFPPAVAVGTAAAEEAAVAITAAEGAAAVGEAAAAEASAGLGASQALMSGLRLLARVALPHLRQGAMQAGMDAGVQLAHGRLDLGEVGDAFLDGTRDSAIYGLPGKAVGSLSGYQSLSAGAKFLADRGIGAIGAAAVAVDQQLTDTGHVSLSGTATTTASAVLFDGGLRLGGRALKHVARPGVAPAPRYAPCPDGAPPLQSVNQMISRVDLDAHEDLSGKDEYGHTIARHVAATLSFLRQRITDRNTSTPSTFRSRAEAEHYITTAIRANSKRLLAWERSNGEKLTLHVDLGEDIGWGIANGQIVSTQHIVIVLRKKAHGICLKTAFPKIKGPQ